MNITTLKQSIKNEDAILCNSQTTHDDFDDSMDRCEESIASLRDLIGQDALDEYCLQVESLRS